MIGDILQPTHLLFILVIALIVLGPKRLPEVGRSLGRGLRDFKVAVSGEETEPTHESLSQAQSVERQPSVESQPTVERQPTVESQPSVESPAPPPAQDTAEHPS